MPMPIRNLAAIIIAGVMLALVLSLVNSENLHNLESTETGNQSELIKQLELTKASLLNPLVKQVATAQRTSKSKGGAPENPKSSAEATALVEKSIDKFAKLFLPKPKGQTGGGESLVLESEIQQELNAFDTAHDAENPSRVTVSKVGKLKGIYPSFEVSNIIPNDISSLKESTLNIINSRPKLFGIDSVTTIAATRSHCGKKLCTTTIAKEVDGLPAWDHSLVIATNGVQVVSILGEFQAPTLSVNASDNLSKEQITNIISAHFKIEPDSVKMTSEPERGVGRVSGHDYIGYRTNVDLGSNDQYQVSVNSRSKQVVEALSLVMPISVPASGITLNGGIVSFRADQQGSTYSLKDDRFPVGFTTSVYSAAGGEWLNSYLASSGSATSNWDPAAVTSIFNTELLMDYYGDNHNYRAIDSNGRNLEIVVNALIDGDSENAFWRADLQLMVFGKGNGVSTGNWANSLDVHAHEMTHGVISSTSNLRYQFQSGALNEAFADFFGTQLDGQDWEIGEDIRLDGTPIRSLANPNLYNQPAHISQYSYLSPSQDNGGVHVNSGIPNRAMYLLVSGLSEENLGTSVGRDKAGQIIWETMVSLPNDATFEDAAVQMIAIAGSLYGSESIEQAAAKAAWDAVGIPQENLLLSTVGLSNSEFSTYNSVLYVSPLYDLEVVSLEDNSFDLYAQHYTNESAVFSAQLNYGPLNTNPVSFARPSQVFLQDGSYVTLYRSTDGRLFSYSSATGIEEMLDFGFDVSDITLSSDGQILVFSIFDAPLIYAYDYATQLLSYVEIKGPNFSETEAINGNVSFVDTLRFDPSSRRIVFDYLTCSFQAVSDCSQADASLFWSIGILDIETEQIAYPFPSQPASIDVGFPSFSNLTDQYITFDLIDYAANTESGTASYVIIYDQYEKDFDAVGFPDQSDEQPGSYGMPSFSADDSGVTFAIREDNGASFLIYSELEGYTLPISRSYVQLNPFFAYSPFSTPLLAIDRDPILSLESSSINFGGVLLGTIQSQPLCASNSDLFPIRIAQLQDSSASIQWLGAGSLLSSGERICGELTLDTSILNEGTLTKTVSISHDGANSPTAITIDAIISEDTDADDILDYIDNDDDNDGVNDALDTFPLDPSETIDTDADGVGNNADIDDDNDGVLDANDAYPLISLNALTDTDLDGLPNECDSDCLEVGMNADADDDGDGVNDVVDAFPLDSSEQIDTDGDKVGDNADSFPDSADYTLDSDSDGMPNAWEAKYGLDPYDASDAASDQDNDGVSAYDEFIAGTIPAGSLDIDGNGQYDALTDGLLLLRDMFGLSESALISGAVASDAAYTSSSEIVSRIEMLGDLVDIDGNDRVDALTDGLIILRYLFGLRGDVLISGVIASDATVTSADGVGAKMESLMPAL
jgi:aureolysin